MTRVKGPQPTGLPPAPEALDWLSVSLFKGVCTWHNRGVSDVWVSLFGALVGGALVIVAAELRGRREDRMRFAASKSELYASYLAACESLTHFGSMRNADERARVEAAVASVTWVANQVLLLSTGDVLTAFLSLQLAVNKAVHSEEPDLQIAMRAEAAPILKAQADFIAAARRELRSDLPQHRWAQWSTKRPS